MKSLIPVLCLFSLLILYGYAGGSPRKVRMLGYVELYDGDLDLTPVIDKGIVSLTGLEDLHTAVEIEGDGKDNGNVRMQVVYETDYKDGTTTFYVQVKEREPGFISVPEEKTNGPFLRKVTTLEGTVNIDNKDLVGPDGKGIIAEVWGKDPVYKTGTRDCNIFVRELLDKLNLKLPPDIDNLLNLAKQHYLTREEPPIQRDVVPIKHYVTQDKAYLTRQFLVDKIDKDSPVKVTEIPKENEHLLWKPDDIREIQQFGSPPDAKLLPGVNIISPGHDSTSSFDMPGPDSDSDDSCLERRGGTFAPRDCKPKPNKLENLPSERQVTLSRINNRFQVATSFGLPALAAADVGGLFVAAAFVILDFIDGHFQAASLALASLAVGAASLLIGGPVGIIIAGLSAIFSILPGLFDMKTPPSSNDQKIMMLQWTFFGDTKHTGNEKCNENRKKAKLEPNCTVVYGAGVISRMFKWSIFDAVSFLLGYNKGHSMSLIDIAAVFNVSDHSYTGGNTTSPVMIDCGSHIDTTIPSHLASSTRPRPDPPSKGYRCESPKYSLDRTKINIPGLNTTAAEIYPRVIPADKGDCKIVSDPVNGVNVGFWNITITGRPVAIACNLTGNYAGVILNPSSGSPNSSNSSSQLYSPANNTQTSPLLQHNSSVIVASNGNTTTDHSTGRAYISPPTPAVPFSVLNSNNSVCLKGTNQYLCLPNGTYTTQRGSWGFNTKYVTGLEMPSASELKYNTSWVSTHDLPSCAQCIGSGYAEAMYEQVFFLNVTDGTAESKQLKANLSIYSGSDLYQPFSVQTPPALIPPSVCLFSETSYTGEVGCFGVGGGNMTSTYSRKAKSLSIVGGATTWIYPSYYGDLGGVYVSTSVEDLSQLPYGTNGNFSQQIRAMWISVVASA